MEQDLLTIFQFATPAVALIYFTAKVLTPLTNLLVAKLSGTDIATMKRVQKLESNDLVHIESRLSSLESQMKDFSSFQKACLDAQLDAQKQFTVISSRLATLEERTRK